MKVVNLNPILFKGAVGNTTSPINVARKSPNNQDVTELQNSIPEYNVSIPQKYSNLGVTELKNGLKIHSYKLANGHRVTIVPMVDSPAVVKNYVNVGSMNETDDIKGISHFLEHMAFNGTTGEKGYLKLNTGDSFKKIDELGGWTNASTSYAVTDYINSTPLLDNTDLEQQIKILSAMTEDLALTDKMIEKEKGPVCSEINMIMDDPQTIAMDQTVRTLFNIKSSADELIAGSVKHIQNLDRNKVKEYYEKYYTPDNMNLVITGDVDPQSAIELVAKNFKSKKERKGRIYEEKLSPINKAVRKDFKSDKTKTNTTVIGFAGPKNNDTKAAAIMVILAKYLSSTRINLNKELEDKNAHCYFYDEKISTNPNSPRLITLTKSSSEENSEETLRIMYKNLINLTAPNENELQKIKKRIISAYKNNFEYSDCVNNMIGSSILNNNEELVTNYEDILNEITPNDIQEFINKYINLDKAAITVIHPKETNNSVNFKGHNRKPTNTDNIEQTTLNNNYQAGFYKTKNDKVIFNIDFHYDLPENINPSAFLVLNEIYNNGTKNQTKEEINKFKEENNNNFALSINKKSLSLFGSCDSKEDFTKTFDKAKELLYTPRITQEEFDKAVKNIKDNMSRYQYNSYDLYDDFDYHSNKFGSSFAKNKESIKNLTLKDVQNLHNYVINNSGSLIKMTLPYGDEELKNNAISEFQQLHKVQPLEYKINKIYQQDNKSIVLTKANNNSQADITQTYKFPTDDSPKEIALRNLMTSILSSSSIGLFNILREKEHLAYSVNASSHRQDDCGYLNCSILTTTDNKETGEQSFENVQKSINGFNRQINCLLNSEFSDQDLISAKKKYKANLLDNEGNGAKLCALGNIYSNYGIEYDNLIYDEIDKITREDIVNYAQKVFSNPPVYSIVATQDTIDANAEYLKNLEV